MDTALTVSGALTNTDLQRLTRLTRRGSVGPTAVYYAGVTGPVIAAGMGLLTKTAFGLIGMSDYWTLLLSALIAAMSGVSWYLIFMRLSYRHHSARAGEIDSETRIAMTEDALVVRRGAVETRIGWPAVTDVRLGRGYIAVLCRGADDVLVPDRWFADDADRQAFQAQLNSAVRR